MKTTKGLEDKCLRQTAGTLGAICGQRSVLGKRKRQSVADNYGETRKKEQQKQQ